MTVWVKNNVWDISKTLQGLKNQLPEIIQCVIYIFLIFNILKIFSENFSTQSKLQKKIFGNYANRF